MRGGWTRHLVVAAPWLTVVLLVVMFAMLDKALTVSPGVAFELPGPTDATTGGRPDLVALAMPAAGGTFLFFDDARYSLDDPASVAVFRSQLSERLPRTERRSLLVLADRNVTAANLMKIADAARKAGAGEVLFAEKRQEAQE